MGFVERIVVKLAARVFEKVFKLVKDQVNKAMQYDAIYKKHDLKKNEMAEELAQAETEEERDAILSKIYNSRPTFD